MGKKLYNDASQCSQTTEKTVGKCTCVHAHAHAHTNIHSLTHIYNTHSTYLVSDYRFMSITHRLVKAEKAE